jgi:hypothetical protein
VTSSLPRRTRTSVASLPSPLSPADLAANLPISLRQVNHCRSNPGGSRYARSRQVALPRPALIPRFLGPIKLFCPFVLFSCFQAPGLTEVGPHRLSHGSFGDRLALSFVLCSAVKISISGVIFECLLFPLSPSIGQFPLDARHCLVHIFGRVARLQRAATLSLLKVCFLDGKAPNFPPYFTQGTRNNYAASSILVSNNIPCPKEATKRRVRESTQPP